jgi:hypothetical protein
LTNIAVEKCLPSLGTRMHSSVERNVVVSARSSLPLGEQRSNIVVDPMEVLPAELQRERQRLEKLFTVDTAMLKKITKRFGEELEEGAFLSNEA